MSGHSKWATIKHKKGAADKARAKVFNKIARQLEVAAREGGGDPSTNASLRTVILKAKAAQMTNDAIDRAVKRGAGVTDGGTYESITYEGYAPGGVAMLVDVLTDNRHRSGGDVRNIYKVGLNTSRVLMALGDVVCAWLLLRQAEVALRRLDSGLWGDSMCEVVTARKQFAPTIVAPGTRLRAGQALMRLP